MNRFFKVTLIGILAIGFWNSQAMEQQQMTQETLQQLIFFYGSIVGKIDIRSFNPENNYIFNFFKHLREMIQVTQSGTEINMKPFEQFVFDNYPKRVESEVDKIARSLDEITKSAQPKRVIQSKPKNKKIVYSLSHVVGAGVIGLALGGALTWAYSLWK